jgi:hypothetical protein
MALLALTGCGADPTDTTSHWNRPAPSNGVSHPQPVASIGLPGGPAAPGAQPVAPGAPGAANPQAVQGLLMGVRQAKQNFTGFSATINTWEKGPKGLAIEKLKIYFKKPGTLRISVLDSNIGDKGTELLWPGSDSVKVKPSYLPFAVNLDLGDDRLASRNGWKLSETDVNSVLKVLLDPSSQLTPLGTQPQDGKMLQMVELHSSASPKGATKEVIGVDPSNNLPCLRMIFNGETLMYKMTMSGINMKCPTEDQLSL